MSERVGAGFKSMCAGESLFSDVAKLYAHTSHTASSSFSLLVLSQDAFVYLGGP